MNIYHNPNFIYFFLTILLSYYIYSNKIYHHYKSIKQIEFRIFCIKIYSLFNFCTCKHANTANFFFFLGKKN